MVALIIAGFASGKTGLSSLGAGVLFLPVFAQFATVMFFLAGLGFLNLAWLPVLDTSFDIGRLGDIVYLPYDLLLSLFRGWGVDIHEVYLVNLCRPPALRLLTDTHNQLAGLLRQT